MVIYGVFFNGGYSWKIDLLWFMVILYDDYSGKIDYLWWFMVIIVGFSKIIVGLQWEMSFPGDWRRRVLENPMIL